MLDLLETRGVAVWAGVVQVVIQAGWIDMSPCVADALGFSTHVALQPTAETHSMTANQLAHAGDDQHQLLIRTFDATLLPLEGEGVAWREPWPPPRGTAVKSGAAHAQQQRPRHTLVRTRIWYCRQFCAPAYSSACRQLRGHKLSAG